MRPAAQRAGLAARPFSTVLQLPAKAEDFFGVPVNDLADFGHGKTAAGLVKSFSPRVSSSNRNWPLMVGWARRSFSHAFAMLPSWRRSRNTAGDGNSATPYEHYTSVSTMESCANYLFVDVPDRPYS